MQQVHPHTGVPQKGISRLGRSWMSYDSAAHRRSLWLLHHSTIENIGDRPLQIVLRRLRPLLPKTEIAIIDASVVHGAKSIATAPFRNKNCRLRRDLRMCKSN